MPIYMLQIDLVIIINTWWAKFFQEPLDVWPRHTAKSIKAKTLIFCKTWPLNVLSGQLELGSSDVLWLSLVLGKVYILTCYLQQNKKLYKTFTPFSKKTVNNAVNAFRRILILSPLMLTSLVETCYKGKQSGWTICFLQVSCFMSVVYLL